MTWVRRQGLAKAESEGGDAMIISIMAWTAFMQLEGRDAESGIYQVIPSSRWNNEHQVAADWPCSCATTEFGKRISSYRWNTRTLVGGMPGDRPGQQL